MEAQVPVPMVAPPQPSQPVVPNPVGEDQSGNNNSGIAGHEIQHQPPLPSPPTAATSAEPAQQQQEMSLVSSAAGVAPGVIAASSAAAEHHAGGDGGVASPSLSPAGPATSTPGAVKREGSGGSQSQPRSAKRSREASIPVGLPKNMVRRIMKIGEDTRNISNEALVIVVKASELFLERFAAQAFDHAEKLGRKTIKYRDVSDIRVNDPNLLFLEAVVPP